MLTGCVASTDQSRPEAAPLPENISLSGNNHVVMRWVPEGHYLLLPVQESASEGRLRVIENGRETDNLVIRLAVDSIDYFVPYEWKSTAPVVMDMCFWNPDKKGTGNYVCWQAICQADTFDTSNREAHRPVYHHSPAYGWMNDPNGMYYDDATGLWHLYYQWNPYCSMWQNMTWGYSVSPDLIHWTHLPSAIMPDGLGTIFSGSAVIDRHNTAGFGENAVVAVYTQAEVCGQMQSIAYSTDGGLTFTPYTGNPVLTDSIADFRDPKVFWDELAECWTMALACQQEIRFYQSPDLKHWACVSRFGQGAGCHGGVWECPDLIKLSVVNSQPSEEKWVLLVNINPGGPFGGSATQYFVGNWDGKEFVMDGHGLEVRSQNAECKWLDYGKDHYAAVTWHNAPEGV